MRDDKVLFARLKSRDKEAFIKAYDLYIDHIFRFIYFKIGDKEEAEDLTSAVFLKTWNYVQNSNFLDSRTLKSLIYKIARNSIIDYYRERVMEDSLSANEETPANLVDESQDAEKKISLTFDLAAVEKKLRELKDEYREIIILRFVEDFSISEIAEILGKTNGNVRVLVYRALKALRELVNNN